MTEFTKFLKMNEILDKFRKIVVDLPVVTSLSAEDREKLTFGTSIDGELGFCSAYITGERPQDARILATYIVHRRTGEATDAALASEADREAAKGWIL